MVYGYYPFNPADPGLPKKMMEGRISYPPGVAVSNECKDLIQGGRHLGQGVRSRCAPCPSCKTGGGVGSVPVPAPACCTPCLLTRGAPPLHPLLRQAC